MKLNSNNLNDITVTTKLNFCSLFSLGNFRSVEKVERNNEVLDNFSKLQTNILKYNIFKFYNFQYSINILLINFIIYLFNSRIMIFDITIY